MDRRFAPTDSDGVEEETSYLGIKCITLRESTVLGTHRLVRVEMVSGDVARVLAGQARTKRVIPFWDRRTTARVVASLKGRLR